MNEPSIIDIANTLKDELFTLLNPSAFTLDSLEGVAIVLLALFLIYSCVRKAVNFIGWLIGLIVLFQIGHWLSFTGLNNYVALDVVFKYDVLTAIAQCFVVTKICDWLLYINAFIKIICNGLWSTFSDVPFIEFLQGIGKQVSV